MDMSFGLRYTDYNMKSQILKILIMLAMFAAVSRACALTVREDPVAAAAYNQAGVEAYNKGAYKSAISYFEQALRLSRGNSTAEKNLAEAYSKQAEYEYEKRAFAPAAEYAQLALSLNCNDTAALYILGDIRYNSGNLEGARDLWTKLIEIQPDFACADDLRKRMDKAETEIRIEKEYRSLGMDQFDIRYAKEGARTGYNVRYYLQEAYRILGQEFGLMPDYRITVILYNKEDFEAVRDWKVNAGGVYDGKIRLPFVGSGFSKEELRGIIWHEYTHLLVTDISRGKAPDWLQEGLAYYEGYKYAGKDLRILKNAVKNDILIPFGKLDSVLSSSSDEVQYMLAAQESYSMAKYLMKRYNKHTIRELLLLLGTGMAFEQAAEKRLYVTQKELERRWLKELKAGELY